MKRTLNLMGAALALTIALPLPSAEAHGYSTPTLTIAHPYALPTPPGATTGGAYLTAVDSKGNTADALVGASSPVADRVEMHTMSMDGDVMRMRAVPSIAIEPGKPIAMTPGGGYHLMMIGIHKPFVVGDRIPLTLQFQHAGRVDVMLDVQARGVQDMDHGAMRH